MRQNKQIESLWDREPELVRLRAALSDGARDACFLLCGEPGIGKTRLLHQICTEARDQSVTVLGARCSEQAGAPPWWPWLQILRGVDTQLADESDQRVLNGITEPDSGISSTQVGSTFRQFAAVKAVLGQVASDKQVLIAIDDLHWADELSLRLVEHLVLSPDRLPLIFVMSYRESELSRHRPLGRTLSRIASDASVERIRLAGLTIEGTGKLMSSISETSLPFDLVKVIHQQTAGNPFFVTEISRYLMEADYVGPNIASLPTVVKIPESIRDVVSERLDRLSRSCRDTLESASVLGRSFDHQTLQLMRSDMTTEQVMQAIDEAVDAHVIHDAVESNLFEFSHALLGESVYDELTRTRRMRLHAQAAQALTERGSNADGGLAALANHWLESATPDAAEKAATCFAQAGQRALAALAFREASEFLDQAIDCLEIQNETKSQRVADLLLQLSDARRRAGHTEASMQASGRAAQIAEGIADIELLARSALAFEDARWRAGLPAHTSAVRLKHALDGISASMPELRVRLFASLARAQSYSVADHKGAELAKKSIDAARELGNDSLLCETLAKVYLALRTKPKFGAQRRALCEEQLQLASDLQDDARIADALSELRSEQLEEGDLLAFDQTIGRYVRVANRLKEPHHLFQLQFVQAMRALFDGRFGQVAVHANNARHIGAGIEGADAAGVHAIQMFQLCRDTGRLNSVAPLLDQIVGDQTTSLWQPGLALLRLELGQMNLAAEQFQRFATREFSALAFDELRETSLAFAAEVCARIEDRKRAEQLFELLEPYQGKLIVLGPAVCCFGPADRYLGLLAATLGEMERAEQFLMGAVAQAQQTESKPWEARAWVDLACLSDRAKGSQQVIERALAIAQEIGMDGLVDRCKALSGGRKLGLGLDTLTKRELDVLRLLASGNSNKEIAVKLHISNATVATHVRSTLSKTGAKNRTEAAAIAMREGVVVEP